MKGGVVSAKKYKCSIRGCQGNLSDAVVYTVNEGEDAAVTCPMCATVQPVPGELLEELRARLQTPAVKFACKTQDCPGDLADGRRVGAAGIEQVTCPKCDIWQDPPPGLLDYLHYHGAEAAPPPSGEKIDFSRRTSGKFMAVVGKRTFEDLGMPKLSFVVTVTGQEARNMSAMLSIIGSLVEFSMDANVEHQLELWPVVETVPA